MTCPIHHEIAGEGSTNVKRQTFVALINVAALVGTTFFAAVAASAGESRGFVRKPLARGTAAVIDVESHPANDVVSQMVTIEPGASSGWHVHPGTELVTITHGVLTVYAEEHPDCGPVQLVAGQTATANGRPHLARNEGTEKVELLVTYFDVPPMTGSPATGIEKAPAGCPDFPATAGFVRQPVARGTAPPVLIKTGQSGDVVSQLVTIEPGASSGWHVHPGTELVTIMKGVITIFAEAHPNCAPVELGPNVTATADGRPHLARNDGKETVELLVSYFDVRPGNGAPATAVSRPASCPDA
jgi:quercetin dioxygenase-like cupin family protein